MLHNDIKFSQKGLQKGNAQAIYAGLALAQNAYLNIHTDDDFGMSTMVVLCDSQQKLEYDSKIYYICHSHSRA